MSDNPYFDVYYKGYRISGAMTELDNVYYSIYKGEDDGVIIGWHAASKDEAIRKAKEYIDSKEAAK